MNTKSIVQSFCEKPQPPTISIHAPTWGATWSDYDPDTSTANDADFSTTIIPKSNATGGKWNGKSFLCDIPRYIGSNVNDVDTERRIMKILYIYDNYIKGSPNNNKDDRNDVVLRAVYEI